MSGFNEEDISLMIDVALRNTYVAVPGKIIKYDATLQEAIVQPLVKRKMPYEGEERTLPKVTQVPVQLPVAKNGDAFMSMPVAPGDLGLLIFADSDITEYMLSEGEKPVDSGSFANHDVNDAFFIPGALPNKKALKNVSTDNVQIHHGNTNFEVGNGKYKFEAGASELLTELSKLIDALQKATVATSIGPQPLDAPTQASLSAVKAYIDGIKL